MFRGGSRRGLVPSICMTALLMTVAVPGCGSDDESTAKNEPRISAASEPVAIFIKRLVKLLETSTAKQDCKQLEDINARSYFRFSCPPGNKLHKSLKSFEVVGSKEYGTGAVVDYKSGKVKNGAAILLFVAPDRNWGISRFGVVTKPSTETDDEESRQGFEMAVEKYLAAVRERDCAAFQEVAFIRPDSTKKQVCGEIFGATKELARRIKAHPTTKPKYEGGNATYGFFTFETTKPDENSTISVVRGDTGAGSAYVVLNVAPSPTSLVQQAVRKQFKERQRTGNEPKGSPARRAE